MIGKQLNVIIASVLVALVAILPASEAAPVGTREVHIKTMREMANTPPKSIANIDLASFHHSRHLKGSGKGGQSPCAPGGSGGDGGGDGKPGNTTDGGSSSTPPTSSTSADPAQQTGDATTSMTDSLGGGNNSRRAVNAQAKEVEQIFRRCEATNAGDMRRNVNGASSHQRRGRHRKHKHGQGQQCSGSPTGTGAGNGSGGDGSGSDGDTGSSGSPSSPLPSPTSSPPNNGTTEAGNERRRRDSGADGDVDPSQLRNSVLKHIFGRYIKDLVPGR